LIRILCVVGARPNFMKAAPLLRALARRPSFEARLVHTGQHYDDALSKIFFDELGLRRPDVELGAGSGTLAVQTAEVMRGFEAVLLAEQPHAVLVIGDVNSTVACALVAARFHRREPFRWSRGPRTRPVLIHVEAGLRSFDEDMPEEINRKLTDAASDVLFASEASAMANLAREGVPAERCFLVGNVLIDTLLAARGRTERSGALEALGLPGRRFGLVTLHRPSNVDAPARLRTLVEALEHVGGELPLVFPVHPRTRARLDDAGLRPAPERLRLTEPLGYLDFLGLMSAAELVLTDSGGVQEETTALGVPCLTLRENTERPATITEGTNRLAGTRRASILEAFRAPRPRARVPALWDGRAAERVADTLSGLFPE
jgi:UDP-N-acetylglucosamine 2-epimerase (non-hydrolysing)